MATEVLTISAPIQSSIHSRSQRPSAHTQPLKQASAAHSRTNPQLPPISAFTFSSILAACSNPPDTSISRTSADPANAISADLFEQAITGIAEICAKNRFSLADEYGAHMPPLGEITAASRSSASSVSGLEAGMSSTAPTFQSRRGGGRMLTSVPEASSGSEASSRQSRTKQLRGFFGLRRGHAQQRDTHNEPCDNAAHTAVAREVQISRAGRTVEINGTTALSRSPDGDVDSEDSYKARSRPIASIPSARADPSALLSLQRVLQRATAGEGGVDTPG